jgi:hypothetical protein
MAREATNTRGVGANRNHPSRFYRDFSKHKLDKTVAEGWAGEQVICCKTVYSAHCK